MGKKSRQARSQRDPENGRSRCLVAPPAHIAAVFLEDGDNAQPQTRLHSSRGCAASWLSSRNYKPKSAPPEGKAFFNDLIKGDLRLMAAPDKLNSDARDRRTCGSRACAGVGRRSTGRRVARGKPVGRALAPRVGAFSKRTVRASRD